MPNTCRKKCQAILAAQLGNLKDSKILEEKLTQTHSKKLEIAEDLKTWGDQQCVRLAI